MADILQTLLAAIPDSRLAALVIELARASNPPTSAPAPQGAPTKRGPGWLKGRPRGPRKVAAATEPAAKTTTRTASPADAHKAAMLAARRTRKNQARSARRAAARQAKAGNNVETITASKATNGAAAAPAPAAPAKRPQGWPKGRPRGPRKVATGNKAGNGAAHAPAPAPSTPAARLWARAAALAPTMPWRAVAREFGTNEAQAQDCCRTGTLPPGIAAAALERFLEAAPAA